MGGNGSEDGRRDQALCATRGGDRLELLMADTAQPIGRNLEVVRREPFNAETPAAVLADAITPTSRMFVRSNFAVPMLAGESHRLAVTGAVGRALEISVGELRAMRESCREIAVTMECAGNSRLHMCPLPAGEPWSNGAVSTCRWTGYPLRQLLERAEVGAQAIELLIEGADSGAASDASTDGFARSLPIAEAMREDVLLAFDVNGEPLTAEHGAPLRLIVPGWYGMASVKWVSRISALTHPFEGYFQKRRYVYEERDRTTTPVTRMRVKSIITSPADRGTIERGSTKIAGWAWSGYGRIVRVEIAVDGNGEWREAELHEPRSDHAWVRWSLNWDADQSGRHVVRSRATDALGNSQPDAISWNRLGYGNNAVRPVVFTVE
jgi:DMSO/TMAO reductase YedYZ molybdopterin-dependent catalytic subunit